MDTVITASLYDVSLLKPRVETSKGVEYWLYADPNTALTTRQCSADGEDLTCSTIYLSGGINAAHLAVSCPPPVVGHRNVKIRSSTSTYWLAPHSALDFYTRFYIGIRKHRSWFVSYRSSSVPLYVLWSFFLRKKSVLCQISGFNQLKVKICW